MSSRVDARGEIVALRRAQGVFAVGRRDRGDRRVARRARLRSRAGRSSARSKQLARKRGIYDVFALTLQPEFFSAIGYQRVDRARYPEKIRRDCLGCARRFACNEICFAKNLRVEAPALPRRTARSRLDRFHGMRRPERQRQD